MLSDEAIAKRKTYPEPTAQKPTPDFSTSSRIQVNKQMLSNFVMNLTTRIATQEDIPVLTRLYAEQSGEPPLSTQHIERLLSAIARLPDYHIYLSLYNDQPVGTFSLLFVPNYLQQGSYKFALLDAIALAKAYSNSEIGTKMLEDALSISAASGCCEAILTTHAHPAPFDDFYHAIGFQQQDWRISLPLNHAT
jgi:GNAT superfamily N-acetyltransferase